MSLIARHFEANGLPTLILGSAIDILKAGQPPRVKFVNYPLGFEAGRFQDQQDQLRIVREAVSGFDTMQSSAFDIIETDWQAGWDTVNEREKGKLDQRSPRTTEPQYQNEEDRIAAED